jgi:hypothetical protein
MLPKALLILLFFFLLVISPLWGQLSFSISGNIATGYTSGSQRNYLEAADLNGDGIADLVTTNGSDQVSVMMIDRNGSQLGSPSLLTVSGMSLFGIVLADVDSDRDNDIVVARENYGISVFKNNGVGVFSGPSNFSFPPSGYVGSRVIRSLDYDGDGDLDIVTYIYYTVASTSMLVLFQNDGTGAFAYFVKTIPDPSPPTFVMPAYNTIHDLAVGIFDTSVGEPEVLFTSNAFNHVYRIYNLSNPSLSSAVAVNGAGILVNNLSIDVGDIDRDGAMDIAITSDDTSPANDIIAFVKGSGMGTFNISFFSDRILIYPASPNYPYQVKLADLDNDTDLDAVISLRENTNLLVYRNEGFPPFSSIMTSQAPVSTINQPTALTVADFNTDGIPDIAATRQVGDDVRTILNTSPPTAAAPPPDNQIFGDALGSYLIHRGDAVLKKTSNFTVEGWFRFKNPGFTGDNQYFFYNGNITAFNGFGLYLEDVSGRIIIDASGFPINTGFTLSPTDNKWHHFAVVRDKSGEWHFYLDGQKNTGTLGFTSVSSPTLRTVFFKDRDNPVDDDNSLRDAGLQEFRFWNTALGEDVIRKWMHIQVNKTHPYYFALASYVPMDRTQGNGDIAFAINPFAMYRTIDMEVLGSMDYVNGEVAPIGDGGSTARVSGSADFNARPQVDILINFDDMGTFPDGNIYVSRVYDNMPDDFYPPNPTLVYSKVFWVFRQYGGNISFSPVDEIEIDIKEDQFRSGLYPILNTPSDPNPLAAAFKIFMRPIGNTDPSAWVQVGYGEGFGSVRARRPASTVNEFGRELTVGVDVDILPVRLVSFTGKKLNTTTNLLEWVTSFEFNNEVFEIEKSYDGKNFFKIGFVAGKEKATSLSKYEFRDTYAETSAYYRLSQKDRSGKKSYTQVIYIAAENENSLFGIYPNPASDKVQLRLPSQDTIEWELKLYDLQGNLHLSVQGNKEKLEEALSQKIFDLSNGLYAINLCNGEKLWSSKFVKK